VPEALSLRSFSRAVVSASRGIATVWREESHFRIESLVGAAALALSWWLGAGTAIVLLFTALVLGLELVNSAFERLADALHPHHHPLVGAAKDAAAGAVAVAAFLAVLAGLVVMGPALLARLGATP
jgi:diacylglycerol kinase (ATP)